MPIISPYFKDSRIDSLQMKKTWGILNMTNDKKQCNIKILKNGPYIVYKSY